MAKPFELARMKLEELMAQYRRPFKITLEDYTKVASRRACSMCRVPLKPNTAKVALYAFNLGAVYTNCHAVCATCLGLVIACKGIDAAERHVDRMRAAKKYGPVMDKITPETLAEHFESPIEARVVFLRAIWSNLCDSQGKPYKGPVPIETLAALLDRTPDAYTHDQCRELFMSDKPPATLKKESEWGATRVEPNPGTPKEGLAQPGFLVVLGLATEDTIPTEYMKNYLLFKDYWTWFTDHHPVTKRPRTTFKEWLEKGADGAAKLSSIVGAKKP